ncbi:MAG: cation diffusion facilitator family transporter, partial [Kiritimatiellales bacterium]|nr:cation diffusion facilitator family transporter [Kiritimatiellales bacterium]
TATSVVLCAIKGWLGLVSGSISMLADATNNLTDIGSSLVIALGFQWSRKPRDEEHPFGHGRIEAVATLVLSIALLVVGFEVARSGIGRLIHPKPVDAPGWMLVVVGVTVVLKFWLAVFARRLAKISKSHVLEADAWNHTFDVACTLLVVVALIGARMGLPSLDGWTAIGVSLFILFTGFKYAREAIDILLGTKPDANEVGTIHKIVEAVDGVMGVHEIMVHHYGDVRMVSFHIEVDAKLTVIAAHHLAEMAEEAVEIHLQWRAVAHVDPVDRSHPMFDELHAALCAHVHGDAELIDFHDLRASGGTAPYHVSFDLVTGMGTRHHDYPAIYERSLTMLAAVGGNRVATAEIGIEASVESAPMERRRFDLLPAAGK